MLRDHRADLLGNVDQCIFMTKHDRREDAHVFLQLVLPRKHSLHLSAKELQCNGLSHVGKLVLLASRVNHALSLNNSRPISMRRISEVPAPIS